MSTAEDQNKDDYDSIEVIMRGRHTWDLPTAKPGEIGETKMKTHISYYKLIVNGKTHIEVDVTAAKFIVAGVDRLAEARAAAGL